MAESKYVPTEDYEQIKLAVWLTKQKIKFYAIPNGGRRNLLEAMKLKRAGVQRGVPDICVPIPSGGYHSLYLELKRQKGGVTSFEQKEWINWLNDNGFYVRVANGFEEAKMVVEFYLSLTPRVA
jgi:hypothetical protein